MLRRRNVLLLLVALALVAGVHSQGVKVTSLRGTIGVDDGGDLYVALYDKGSVVRVSGEGETVYVSGIDKPRSPVFDSGGNLYVGSFDGNIYKVPPGGGRIVVAAGIWSPQGMGVDREDRIYVAGGYDGMVYRIGEGGKQALYGGFDFPTHLAVGPDGAIYLTERGSNRVYRLCGDGKEVFVEVDGNIRGMAVDEGGDLYLSYLDKVIRIVDGEVEVMAEGLERPSYLAVYKNSLFVCVSDGVLRLAVGPVGGWRWSDPNGDDEYSVDGDRIRLKVNPHQDMWWCGRGTAPMLTVGAPETERWRAEATLSLERRVAATHVGLVVWDGEESGTVHALYIGLYDVGRVRVEGSYSGTCAGWPETLRGIEGNVGRFDAAYDGTVVHLRIDRVDRGYAFYYRPPGSEEWFELGVVATAERLARVGLIGKSWGGGGVEALFTGFRVGPLED